MKKVVIYPGRFQPMLSHHAEVYRQLQSQFPDADVYIGTSDKVELPKSPFNFKEKQLIAKAHGIDPSKVLQVARPYHKDDYKQFDEDNTIIIFAVGEKDLDRFPFGNIDPETGLDMTVKGETKPKYYQKINTLKADPRSMQERGYITLAPTVKAGDDVASASAFRDAIKNAPDEESAKQVFTKQFGNFDQKVFDLIYSKVKGTEMSEQINILRKLAGLKEAPVQMPDFAAGERPTTPKEREAYRKWKAGEKADVTSAGDTKPEMDFEPISPKDRKDAAERPAKADASNPAKAIFTKIKPEDMIQKGKPIPSKQRKNSLANRFPANADINNTETKKEMFLKVAARTPYLLFSEINARLGNDENSLAVSDKLSDIVSKFADGEKLMDLPADEKSFALRVLGNAINNMELVRSTDVEDALDEPEDDDDENNESFNLDDIRADYDVDEDLADDELGVAEGAVCAQCGDPNCTCPPGECDCVPVEEEYTHDDFKKDRVAKVKSTGATGRVIARYRHDDGEIHYTLDHGGNKTSKHPASDLAVHKEEVEEASSPEINDELWAKISARKAELMGPEDDEMEPEEAQDIAAEEFGVDPGDLNDWLDSKYDESVEATANNAFEAAMAELKKLAGL